MSVRFAENNTGNHRLIDLKYGRQNGLGCPAFSPNSPYLAHLIARQSAHRSPLHDHIDVIVMRRSPEQVKRIAARRIVAGVAGTQRLGENIQDSTPLMQDQGEPVCEHHSPMARQVDAEYAIALIESRLQPWPARTRAARRVNVAPEPLVNRLAVLRPARRLPTRRGLPTGTRTEAVAPLQFGRDHHVQRAALGAGIGDLRARLFSPRGSIRLHRDLSLSRNRGARPEAVTSSARASSCPDFTTADQIGRAA